MIASLMNVAADGISHAIVARVFVPAPGKKTGGSSFNFVRSWMARLGPVQIKLDFEDKIGKQSSHVFEFANPAIPLSEPERDDVLFVYCDDVHQYERYPVRCRILDRKSDTLLDEDDTDVSFPPILHLSILSTRNLFFQQ